MDELFGIKIKTKLVNIVNYFMCFQLEWITMFGTPIQKNIKTVIFV